MTTRKQKARLIYVLHMWKKRLTKIKQHAATQIQLWWRSVPKPTNAFDPITLEVVPRAIGRMPEGGGAWFDLYTENFLLYRYAADALFSYFVSESVAIEPSTRHVLNRTELARLNQCVSVDVQRKLNCTDARTLLSETMQRCRQMQVERDSLLFFLEDDLLTICHRILEDCTRYANGESDFSHSTLDEFIHVFADICQFDISIGKYHLATTISKIKKNVFDMMQSLGTDVFCNIILALERPAQICRLQQAWNRISQQGGTVITELQSPTHFRTMPLYMVYDRTLVYDRISPGARDVPDSEEGNTDAESSGVFSQSIQRDSIGSPLFM
jgi:hypothetical protein